MSPDAPPAAHGAVAPPARPLFSSKEFFESQPAPPRLQEHLRDVQAFVTRNISNGKRVVLVTSGGTTVPLEHNVVRFLDNFSAGTRGSASAEHFLRTGKYAVIFLHRQHSLQPFSRHYSHSKNPFLDLLEIVGEDPLLERAKGKGRVGVDELNLNGMLFPPVPAVAPSSTPVVISTPSASTSGSPQIQIPAKHLPPMLSLLRSYKLVQSLGLLHSISFTTVDEYLFLLRGVSRVMGSVKDAEGHALGRRGMYYLAAAVSDFFIPTQRMSEHKIQSGKGSLTIEMDQVPKVLKGLVEEWSNNGYIVSFKLETDSTLLIPKSRTALERYGHQVVIGNTLSERKHEVVFVEKTGESWLRIGETDRGKIGAGGEIVEIEEEIVAKLVGMHDAWVSLDTV